MRNKGIFTLSILILVAIIAFSLISTKIGITTLTVSIDENRSNIIAKYGPNQTLQGNINISLEDEPYDSLLTGFDGSIELLDFLKKNKLKQNKDYTCTSVTCMDDYAASNPENKKNFTLAKNQEVIVGIKITENSVDDIKEVRFNISSDAPRSCISPLEIDFLNNNQTETIWKVTKSARVYDLCNLNDATGGYNQGANLREAQIRQSQYCNKITILPCPDLKVGANIEGTGDIEVKFTVFDSEGSYDSSCTTSRSDASSISCVINDSITQKTEFDVCIEQESGDEYKINYEQVNAHGSWDEDQNKYDWNLFVRPGAYEVLGEVRINSSEIPSISNEVKAYLEDNYDNNCSDDCIIPIKITSTTNNQKIVLSDSLLEYAVGPGVSRITKLSDLSSTPSKVTMPYTKLNLEKSGINVPVTYGEHTLKLELDGEEIIKKKINVIKIPIINSVVPLEVPAGGNIILSADVDGANITSYIWKFGDNSSATTSVNHTTHKYSKLGTYELTLTAKNSLGQSNRSFTVTAENPKDFLNKSLKEGLEDIQKVRSQVNALPSWEKTYVSSKINLNSLETQIAQLKTEFESAAGASEKYIATLGKLNALEIPSSLESRQNSSGQFIIDRDLINVNTLQSLGAGTPEEAVLAEYKDSIFGWVYNSLNLNVEGKTYSLYYEDSIISKHVATRFKVTVSPKNTVQDEVYFVITKPKAQIGFKDASQTENLNGSTGMVFSSLSSGKTVEFILPGNVNILDLPIYLSSTFEQMAIVGEIGPCNNNNKCEAGEDYKNCRSDCKPWGWVAVLIVILILIFLVIYILLQEWYKRHYEERLFKNKNELFNLINFIDNAEKKGMKKEEIVKKLKEKGWNSEQIDYAYNKLKGKRTGMWEIPVFKLLEQKKIAEELAKRKGAKPVGKTPEPKSPQKGMQPLLRPKIQGKLLARPGMRPMPARAGMRPVSKPPEKKKSGLKALFSKKVSIPIGKKTAKK